LQSPQPTPSKKRNIIKEWSDFEEKVLEQKKKDQEARNNIELRRIELKERRDDGKMETYKIYLHGNTVGSFLLLGASLTKKPTTEFIANRIV
jgi:hypothetical protein